MYNIKNFCTQKNTMYNICCNNITIQYIFKTYYLQVSNIKILYKYNILLNILKKDLAEPYPRIARICI